ncbi:C39 family peptidase [Paenibacillus alkaliterrae]|uniref:C39 family peptidase n=1 Tax=Paenibacillus alkaliterrae TaxID=320909 RepID=UPI001F264EFD|nr:C39 family peptidase [Paenibacillus alkaliterrae]MCF2940197.1 C39 family peptidase [Paenibacillus alkaliterrae]
MSKSKARNKIYMVNLVLFIVVLAAIGIVLFSLNEDHRSNQTQVEGQTHQQQPAIPENEKPFLVFNDGKKPHSEHETLEDAINAGTNLAKAYVIRRDNTEILWNNFKEFTVYQNDKFLLDFDNYAEAVVYAKTYSHSYVYHNQSKSMVWAYDSVPVESILIDAPLISQLPELERGCEVTSLAMMLQHAGIEVGKMELADRVKKDPTPYRKENGIVYFGNPYDGFVGDMTSYSKPGYAVYHGPIKELGEQYLPDRILDMTGITFEDMLYALQLGKPVWVIANTTFALLPDSKFQTWQTPSGPVDITYKEHAVLLTGYDENYVYFNDPLANEKDRKINISSFQQAWEQMGHQAVTYI